MTSANAVNDENILIVDDGAETYKVSANDLAEYINEKSSAQPNVQSDWSEADTEADSYIKNKPTALAANGGDADTVNGHTVNADVPSGAEFTDTVYTHPDSGVAAGTYSSVTVNEQGHVTSGSNPTTLSGYGITDAATIEQGERADTAVQSVKIGTIEYKSGTTVTLPAYPTTLPATDVYEWAKAETKPTYTAAEVGADEEGSADTAYENAKAYTDDRITQLIGTCPENLDTIEELSAAISENQSAIDAIENAITNKASADHNHDESYAAKSSEHTHENKTVLDTITAEKVLSWDNKSDFDGDYHSLTNTPDIPSNISQLTNDAGYITSNDINNSDTADNTVTYTSADSASPTAWTDVPVLSNKERHSSIFSKISTMFKNVRYLYKMLGTTDISTLGNGTVTGALSALNTGISNNIIIQNIPFSAAYSVGRSWASVPYTVLSGYTFLMGNAYFAQPAYMQVGGIYLSSTAINVAYDCYAAGTYNGVVTVLLKANS